MEGAPSSWKPLKGCEASPAKVAGSQDDCCGVLGLVVSHPQYLTEDKEVCLPASLQALEAGNLPETL